MALKISKNVGLTSVVNASNPIETEHVNTGEAKSLLVYLFNDDAAKRFENIVISAVDTTGTNESSWVQFAPNNSGSPGTFANTLNMANISDVNVAKPFWVRVTNASVADPINKTDIQINVDANWFAV